MHVIVTGADGALGSVVTERFEREGHRVAALCGGAIEQDRDGRFAAGDLADEANAATVIARAATWLGQVDGLIHLVGAFRWTEVASARVSDWRDMFEANVATAIACVTATLPHVRDGGSIVLVGANSAQPAGAGFGPYGAAKSGVARLTEALASELAGRRIRVNAILPGVIDTPGNRADMPDADPAAWTSRDAIADAIAFLASPAARAITGALIPIVNAA